MLKLSIAVALVSVVLVFRATPGITQDGVDHTSLITKTSTSEFLVEGAKRIDHNRAHELYKSGTVFVDVRQTWRFDTAHVRGAVSLDLYSKFTKENLAMHVKKNQPVVFYCADSKCSWSANASAKALIWGYTDVYYFADGLSAWTGNNYEQDITE